MVNYNEFRKEYETIARAKLVKPVPMEIDNFTYTAEEWQEWYDNEFGYSCQVHRILEQMAGIAYATYPKKG